MLSLCKTVSAVVLAGSFGSFALVGCAAEDDGPMSWDQFRANAYYDTERELYVIDGDQTVLDLDDLKNEYRDYRSALELDGIDRSSEPLTVDLDGGAWNVWAPGTTVTYCVPTKGFTTARRNALITALDRAGAAWSAAGNINFFHDASQDGSCTN